MVSLALAASSVKGRHTLKAAAAPRYFGAAVAQGHLQNASDPKFASVGSAQFSGATPENEIKWESTEPTQGNFTFEDADVVVQFARKNSEFSGSRLHKQAFRIRY